MHDCSQFGLGTRSLQICLGESELPLRKVNAFRALHGIDPFADDKTSADITGETSQVRASMSPNRPGQQSGRCCGKKTATPAVVVRHAVIGTGVGSRLIEMFKAHGFEACEACYELAHRMNEWGPEGCRTNLELIVADILPRALIWEREKVGWWARLLPEAVTEAAIKLMVSEAIATARPLEWVAEPKPVARRAVRQNPRDFVTRPEASPMLTGPLVSVPFTHEPIRNLVMHVWPTRNGAWRWNLDQIINRLDVFNGKRIVGITTDDKTESANVVEDYLAGHGFEFITSLNIPKLAEMVTFIPSLEKVASSDPNEVTFRCHAKGSKHQNFGGEAHTVQRWTEAMYETCLDDLPAVDAALESHPMAGPFKRYTGLPQVPFHFSGSFYWLRHVPIFQRNWRLTIQQYAGVELWPGKICQPYEAACLFHDNAGNIYDLNEWTNRIEPELKRWRDARVINATNDRFRPVATG